jgi:hypothetical protein
VTPEEVSLARAIGILESLAIPYMVTGSLASSHHGRPRTTHDADIVVEPSRESLDRLVAALGQAGFYVDADRARDALRTRRLFNAIDQASAYKVDLIVRKERPFSMEEFRRRLSAELVPGLRVTIASAEDTLLAKLEWSRKAGGSERQLEDAAGVFDVRPDLDRAYVERWARELGVLDLWEALSRSR